MSCMIEEREDRGIDELELDYIIKLYFILT